VWRRRACGGQLRHLRTSLVALRGHLAVLAHQPVMSL
jgi:hypothetical protein